MKIRRRPGHSLLFSSVYDIQHSAQRSASCDLLGLFVFETVLQGPDLSPTDAIVEGTYHSGLKTHHVDNDPVKCEPFGGIEAIKAEMNERHRRAARGAYNPLCPMKVPGEGAVYDANT